MKYNKTPSIINDKIHSWKMSSFKTKTQKRFRLFIGYTPALEFDSCKLHKKYKNVDEEKKQTIPVKISIKHLYIV